MRQFNRREALAFPAAFAAACADEGIPMHEYRLGAIDPYVRWGDTIRLTFLLENTTLVSEFQRIELPRPLLCRVHYHAEVIAQTAGGVVQNTTFQYSVGVGSSQYTTRRCYIRLPQVVTTSPPNPAPQPRGTPLDVDFYLPLQTLYGRVEARAFNCTIACTLQLTPVSLEELAP